ncbi:MAG: NAAT family transporter [Opitutae bacterium]|nr:NAAT family transporter [Opitutae bacterium]
MSHVTHLWVIYLGTLVGLLPIINPLSAGPTFLAITEGDSEERRREQARNGCLYMVAILVSFLIGGTFIMNFFGISIPGLRIAGGILLTGIGMNMLSTLKTQTSETVEEHEAARRGPGSIAVTLGFTSLATGWTDYFAIIAGIVSVALITYVVLRFSGRLVQFIGPVGVNAMTKMMGFLIMCMGVQFVVNGVINIATDPELLGVIQAALAGR